MKGRRIVLDHYQGREAAALLVDGRLDDLLIDSDQVRTGAIFRAICDRPLKGQGGMMLRIPGGTAFLRQGKGLHPGQAMLVQVTGIAEDGKAVPVTDRVLFKSRFAIITPGAPGRNISRQIDDEEERDRLAAIAHEAMEGADEGTFGLIIRSSAAGADEDDIYDDIREMLDLAVAVMADAEGTEPEALTEGDGPHDLAWREWSAPDIETIPGGFAREGVDQMIEDLAETRVEIGEGTMYVETTRALVAIDVNTGGDTSPAAALKANLAAARALPRALRMRGLGGQIAVDFAPMSKAHRKQVEQSLRASFKLDPIETSLVGWTTMGLFELQRKRERLPLAQLLEGANGQ
ncbi:ribonuclease E/G [Ketogulonicigenium vulgare]|uniref:Ribonuclease G and E-like protein n=1 Tax=Ketogulonicigenium vulgare (strain WSH-001) TaxID=759362 RepID=F9YA40_KETVW|nr:ribonuclease E/G [Ketogulonicigenium vulgare]ADO43153.1 ribonuclease, Rne/Rng family [Ketogulonicigenium vulgare Y25]AEM41451.1 Ribonuclease G and E-like protein [Ketogulonicigenium vulgare WSH-001]ALJ81585.1 ribonuclease G [Ketogulonicigenium vulgare]ANW34266.1 ribonuclease G [Ketogulonicigenium vulgare]AOZ55190.1 ribonuclease, Rne/Rng family [Ketogulonicigenium vulgare]